MRKRAHLSFLAGLAVVACLPLAACGSCGGGSSGSGSSGTSSSSTAALTASGANSMAAASSSAKPRNTLMVRAGGAVGAIFRAVGQSDLSEEQRTKVEKVASDLRDADKAESADGG